MFANIYRMRWSRWGILNTHSIKILVLNISDLYVNETLSVILIEFKFDLTNF